jgi:hypothetical protein
MAKPVQNEEEKIKNAQALRRDGNTIDGISQALGVSHGWASRVCKGIVPSNETSNVSPPVKVSKKDTSSSSGTQDKETGAIASIPPSEEVENETNETRTLAERVKRARYLDELDKYESNKRAREAEEKARQEAEEERHQRIKIEDELRQKYQEALLNSTQAKSDPEKERYRLEAEQSKEALRQKELEDVRRDSERNIQTAISAFREETKSILSATTKGSVTEIDVIVKGMDIISTKMDRLPPMVNTIADRIMDRAEAMRLAETAISLGLTVRQLEMALNIRPVLMFVNPSVRVKWEFAQFAKADGSFTPQQQRDIENYDAALEEVINEIHVAQRLYSDSMKYRAQIMATRIPGGNGQGKPGSQPAPGSQQSGQPETVLLTCPSCGAQNTVSKQSISEAQDKIKASSGQFNAFATCQACQGKIPLSNA